MKNKETLLLVVVVLVVGALVGILVSKGGKKPAPSVTAAPQGAPPAAANLQQKINMLQGIVTQDPSNRNAWVELGNAYFDIDQPAKSIEAYDKALALNPADANVLTDQGVMFRRMGWYDRAIENFVKASDIDPTHAQSLYNLGVVYRYDLQDFPRAKEAWSKYLAINPAGPGAAQVRAELEALETQPVMPGNAAKPGK